MYERLRKGILSFILCLAVALSGGIAVIPAGAMTDSSGKTPIIHSATATLANAKAWAAENGATDLFVGLADLYWSIAPGVGVNPVVAYCQSVIETGWGSFGEVLDASYCNPCGMKTASGGDDYDPSAHTRFSSWNEGVTAHIDHLALYAGVEGYPKADSPDPRDEDWLFGTAHYVEELVSWASGGSSYTEHMLSLIERLEAYNGGEIPTSYGNAYAEDERNFMLNDCNSLSGWSAEFGTTFSLFEATSPVGYDVHMVPVTTNNDVGSMAFYTYSEPIDISDYRYVFFELYSSIDYSTAGRDSDFFELNLFSGENQDGYNIRIFAKDIHSGWQSYTVDLVEVGKAIDDVDLRSITGMRYTWFNYSRGSDVTFGLDTIRISNSAGAYESGGEMQVCDCDSLLGWRTEFNTSLDKSVAQFPAGYFVNINPSSSGDFVGSMAFCDFDNAVDLSAYNYISFEVYSDIDYSTANRQDDFFQINFHSGENQDGYNINIPANQLTGGWHTYTFKKSLLSKAISDVDWRSITGLRFTWFNYSLGSDVKFAVDTVKAFNGDVAAYSTDDKTLMLCDCDEFSGWWPAWSSQLDMGVSTTPEGYYIIMNNAGFAGSANTSAKVGGMLFYDYTVSNNLSDYDTVSLELYSSIDYRSSGRNNDYVELNFTSSLDDQDGYDYRIPASAIGSGWQVIDIPVSSFEKKIDNADWSNIHRMRITWFNISAGSQVDFMFDTIKAVDTGNDIMYGDVNSDGSVNSADALIVLQHCVALQTLTGNAYTAADFNRDGDVKVADALLILQKSVGR